MRSVRLSITFNDQLNELLAHGEDRFGTILADEKKALVFATIRGHLADFPASKARDPKLALHVYPVKNTPFVLLYDFDDSELRIHFVLHRRADLRHIDPADAEWS